MTHNDIATNVVTHDDAIAALREMSRLIDHALTIDARSSIASNINAQRIVHELTTHLRTYQSHVDA